MPLLIMSALANLELIAKMNQIREGYLCAYIEKVEALIVVCIVYTWYNVLKVR